MRVLILYGGEGGRIGEVTKVISSTIQSRGHEVDEVRVENSSRITSFFVYELVYVGSQVMGTWGGKFSSTLASYLRDCSGLEGKKAVVFVTPKLFKAGKAIKRIMNLLEEKGAIVVDFASLRKPSEAEDLAKKISHLE
ncbi:hypothetical protein E3J68_01305 [Candidatus Aerophobetes bacterium]|uniref:Flavodoxin-like domain-containing protein n=1 Tax=Aerophobetes bacterium TaxID=2030807 RepID=A0A523THP6_UNCAE|nr:MAG: hypothetical protein E3J68_01305 [Candidatus Aerophobetes bacterium]